MAVMRNITDPKVKPPVIRTPGDPVRIDPGGPGTGRKPGFSLPGSSSGPISPGGTGDRGLENMPGIKPGTGNVFKPLPKAGTFPGLPGKRLGWTKGKGNPHNPSNVKSNAAKAQRQRKMVDQLKSSKGKLSNKSKSAIQKAAQRRNFSGSIG